MKWRRPRTLRILTISHMFPSVRSERHGIFMCREAQHLRRCGIECCFLVGRPWAPWPLYHVRRWSDYGPANPLLAPDGLQARRIDYFRPPGLGFRRYDGRSLAFSAMDAAKRWHRAEPFDLVLGVSMLPDAEAAAIIGAELGLPVVSLAIGGDVMVYPERMPALWQRLCDTLERIDLPIGVSESICARLAETGKCRREPLCVYLSRDAETFTPATNKDAIRERLGWETDDTVAIYVGGLVETKGMNELAAACAPLLERYANFKLVCVGDGPSRGRLSRLARSTRSKGAVILTGRVKPEAVPTLLQGADFMVLPSYSEGMPQAVLEAMNCGLAVVATRVGGVAEAVVDEETGLLVDPRDARQLGDAIERMIADEAFRCTAGRQGWIRACDVFGSETNARVFADALWSLATGCATSLVEVAHE